ncbi:gamma-glutamyltranspeptidase [Lentithecium fluviatile CBS 122367]|uniref:Glutathione hydrolase n=1 Tax=Lentithecium fluviatile CBS 122367 TaxID=1168545 RepID=A0A6G1J2N4_9PLEO|nr:gamma-glutamyltranspeptidase [Lentithecium fluviatile CBS 122367]
MMRLLGLCPRPASSINPPLPLNCPPWCQTFEQRLIRAATFDCIPFAGLRLLSGSQEPGYTGATASQSNLCSEVGADLLTQGGNAADAMVGTVACVGTVSIYHSGIGGGGFMIVRSPNGTHEFIDFRETAPAAATKDMFRNNEPASRIGGLASGVPGELRGLRYLHKEYGKLDWSTVLAPAVRIARHGWKVNEDLLRNMNMAIHVANQTQESNFFLEDPEFAMDFAPKGRLPKLGETITRKRYAKILTTIAQNGPDAFYTGPIAEATVQALRSKGGIMTLADLRDYSVAIRRTLSIAYRNYKIISTSAPSAGPVLLSILKTMEGYPNISDPTNNNLTTHRLDEAMKHAYGMRAKLGDPSFLPAIDRFQEHMISEQAAHAIRARISDNQTSDASYYDPSGFEQLDTPGTSHIVAADHTGLSISLTTSINLLFGSKVVVPETGLIMNNEMNDFSIPGTTNAFGYISNPNNFVQPGKRPLSSITPVIIEHLGVPSRGAFFAAVGAAGGSRIPTATVQAIIHILDGGISIEKALAAPRMHDQLRPEQVSLEYAFGNETAAYLRGLGKNVTWVAPGLSSVQGLRKLADGRFEAAGEPRQRGSGGFVV